MNDVNSVSKTAKESVSNVVAEGAQPAVSGAKQAVAVASEMKDKVKDAATEAGQAVKDQYRAVSESAQKAYEQARDAGSKWEQSVEEYVRREPVKALVIAAGVGVVLALVCFRK